MNFAKDEGCNSLKFSKNSIWYLAEFQTKEFKMKALDKVEILGGLPFCFCNKISLENKNWDN